MEGVTPMPKTDPDLNPLDYVYAIFEFYYRPQCANPANKANLDWLESNGYVRGPITIQASPESKGKKRKKETKRDFTTPATDQQSPGFRRRTWVYEVGSSFFRLILGHDDEV
jgi:hypothetical protein